MTFKPVTDLARWTRIALFACAAFYAISAAALPGNLAQLNQLEAQAMGQQVLVDGTPSSDFASVGLSAFILTTIVFLFFFHRAYSNLAALGPTEQRWSTGWSVGSWFIPILNLFRPKQIANDIWRGSDGSSVPAIFNWWWAFWILGGAAHFGSEEQGMTIAQAKFLAIVEAIGESLIVVGALCAASVVKLIASRQQLRAQLIGDRQRESFLSSPERIAPQAG
jgi:hypothetical protein